MYDIIGDIHGHSETLVSMLKKMGYSLNNGSFSHPERKAVFVGDLIDRGNDSHGVLKIVRAMVDSNNAHMVLGNHEYNAIAYHTRSLSNGFLRPHTQKNKNQHLATLASFKGKTKLLNEYINWFKSLPLFLELDGINIVHACWAFDEVDFIKKNYPENIFNEKLLQLSVIENTPEFNAVETLLKGKEVILPPHIKYIDKDGHRRRSVRYKWWVKINAETYRTIAVNYEKQVPDVKVPEKIFQNHKPYLADQKPVFVGHYWRTGKPELLSENVCCLDYSIGKGCKLVSYRYDGENKLDNSKFVSVNNID